MDFEGRGAGTGDDLAGDYGEREDVCEVGYHISAGILKD